MYDTQVIRTFEALRSVRNDWNGLWRSAANKTPYQSWEWVAHWARHSVKENNLYVLIVRNRERELVGIAPLELKKYLGITKVATFVGQEASIYPDFIVSSEDSDSILSAMISEILCDKEIGAVDLIISEPSRAIVLLNREIERSKWFKAESSRYTSRLIVNIGNEYERYLAGLSNKMRQEVRTETKKLEKSFAIDFRPSQNFDDFNKDLEILFALNAKRWGGDPSRQHLPRRTCYKALYAEGMVTVFVLSCDGKPAGALSALCMDNILFGEVAGLDFSIANVDLGKVFYNYLFDWMAKNGYTMFDFSSGEEPYKLRYKPNIYGKWRMRSHRNVVDDKVLFVCENLSSVNQRIRRYVRCTSIYKYMRKPPMIDEIINR